MSNCRIPCHSITTSFTCVGVLWRTRCKTIVSILIQWDPNKWRGILQLSSNLHVDLFVLFIHANNHIQNTFIAYTMWSACFSYCFSFHSKAAHGRLFALNKDYKWLTCFAHVFSNGKVRSDRKHGERITSAQKPRFLKQRDL